MKDLLEHLDLLVFQVLQVYKAPLVQLEILVTGVLPAVLVFPERMACQGPLVLC